MRENIVMEIIRDSNPYETKFRKGDFLIGREDMMHLLKKHSLFSEENYQLVQVTRKDVANSKDVKYHYFSNATDFLFEVSTVTKEDALKKLPNKSPIKFNDTRILKDIIDDEDQIYFLKEVAKYESECVLNGDWTTWTKINYKLPQIDYYKSLKSDHDRQTYADAIGQQYALNLLLSPISVLTDSYDLECINTFFKNTEFYYDDTINQNETQDNSEYLTSLNVKELWLPAAHFILDDDTETKTVNGIEFIQIDDAVEQYSFTSNRVRYDSHWYNDFLIKL